MVDFIFAVENPDLWHEQNVEARGQDYSRRGLVRSTRQRFQNMGGALWYHPYVKFGEREIKYGVMSSEALEKDCVKWDRLYAAGRLQKPTDIRKSTAGFDQAQSLNLEMANRVALLLAEPAFTAEDHYAGIAGISYLGDPRMMLGLENPDKIRNIVTGNPQGFDYLHGGNLKALEADGFISRRGVDSAFFERTDDPEALRELGNLLPFSLPDNPQKIPAALKRKISWTVLKSGIVQPLKSKMTATKEAQSRYLAEKKAKSKRVA